jgi:hypothetical protein
VCFSLSVASVSVSSLYVLVHSKWSVRQRLRYVERSIMTGPRFLSERQVM